MKIQSIQPLRFILIDNVKIYTVIASIIVSDGCWGVTILQKFICIDTSAVILRFKFIDTSQFNI